MPNILPLHQWLVLPVQAICSSTAILMIEGKHGCLLNRLGPFRVRIFSLFIVFRQHIVDLGIEVLLVEEGV
jgi:hypothetical protein